MLYNQRCTQLANMSSIDISQIYQTTKQLFGLKQIDRTGWLNSGIAHPESVADHSWGTALLCLVFSDYYQVNRQKVLELAIVHDCTEVITGDIPAVATSPEQAQALREKSAREGAAIAQLFGRSRLPYIKSLWEEYEQSKTKEALVVRDLNLIDMALQALLYTSLQQGQANTLQHFLTSAERRLVLDESRAIFDFIDQDFQQLSLAVR